MERDLDAKKTILVVDDDRDLVTVVEYLLNSKGYTVQRAYTGKEVFSLMQKQNPDLILLDIILPDMDGLEVLTRLKGAPETSYIPVILMTVRGQYQDVLMGYRKGSDYYIPKPFTAAQLFNGINLLLGSNALKN